MGKKALVVVLGCVVAVFVAATAAFVVNKKNTESIITFGNLALKPHLYTVEDGETIEVDPSETIPISETPSLSRMLNIENVGEHPMYVRVGFDTFLAHDDTQKVTDVIYIDEKPGWTYADGFYYYNATLEPGSTTTELMDEIKFDNAVAIAKYKGKEIDFKINIEAVQSEHNEDNALDANGWPEQ